jgi:hypothetical protein
MTNDKITGIREVQNSTSPFLGQRYKQANRMVWIWGERIKCLSDDNFKLCYHIHKTSPSCSFVTHTWRPVGTVQSGEGNKFIFWLQQQTAKSSFSPITSLLYTFLQIFQGSSFTSLLNVLMFTSKVTVTKYFSPLKQDHLIDYKSHRFKDNSVSQFPVYLGCLWKRVCHIYVLWGLSVCSKGIT